MWSTGSSNLNIPWQRPYATGTPLPGSPVRHRSLDDAADDQSSNQLLLTFKERVRHFVWTWFTMTMATGQLANVILTGMGVHMTCLVVKRLTLHHSTLQVPWSICNWLLLLHFQPGPDHLQCDHDLSSLLLVSNNFQGVTHTSYRISFCARLSRLVRHSLDEHYRICCR